MANVRWPARAALPDKSVVSTTIFQIEKNSASIELDASLPPNALVKIEFQVNYRGDDKKIRLKSRVVSNHIVSSRKSVLTKLHFVDLAPEVAHIINNLMQLAMFDGLAGEPKQR